MQTATIDHSSADIYLARNVSYNRIREPYRVLKIILIIPCNTEPSEERT